MERVKRRRRQEQEEGGQGYWSLIGHFPFVIFPFSIFDLQELARLAHNEEAERWGSRQWKMANGK